MATTITDALLQETIIRAVQNVFQTMLKLTLSPVPVTGDSPMEALGAPPYTISHVGFAGELNGTVYLCLNQRFGRRCAELMLGMTAAEVAESGDEVVNDVIGEITNMTTGGFKNALSDLGFPCKLSLPTIVHGDHLAIAAIKSANRQIFHFQSGEHRLIVHVHLQV